MSRVLLVHGWGFGPELWEPLRAALPGPAWTALDLGYFGPARTGLPAGLDLVVGHSFGCLWALAHPGLAGVPLVAVNGFPRLARGEDFPHGVPVRLLERMGARLGRDPDGVLADFHARFGTRPPPGRPRLAALAADLDRLAHGDARGGPAPVLAGAAADDPLVLPALAREAFPGRVRLLATGGHILPLTRPGAVARWIREALP